MGARRTAAALAFAAWLVSPGCAPGRPRDDGERIERITAALADDAAHERWRALGELAQWDDLEAGLSACDAETTARLVDLVGGCLRDNNPQARRLAARALVRLGPSAGAAAPELAGRLGDPDRDTRPVVEHALASLGEAAVPALISTLRGGDSRRTAGALRVIAQLGQRAEDTRPYIEELARTGRGEVRELAQTALVRIGGAVVATAAKTAAPDTADGADEPVVATDPDTRAPTDAGTAEKTPALTNTETSTAGGSGALLLRWDPVTTAVDGSAITVAGYHLHIGTTSGVYVRRVRVGLTTEYRLDGLTPGRKYYVAVSAYRENGVRSKLSSEVVATPR